ncbi:YbaB/EbfC family nucleoid-associated protein [Nonomuraea endophytica]|uniref:DNA-binding protein YbaB n=1 Tax=Nonomuraea endophytica TaxID=714136 RepID=A0A7W8ECV4_9ACTN|nr:YbaB/EbfC family nucleoid-associated protein [Nonomuraea endophytica]MBB5074874.1 DNA-binding protein YbaB [Nonomuraea endophytica]
MEYSEHDLDDLVRASERGMRELLDAMEGLKDTSGTGESRSGMISAAVGHDGRIRKLKIEARAMRLDSAELAEQVVEAVTAAQDDLDRATRALLPPGENADPADIMRQFEDLQDGFARESDARVDRLQRMRTRDHDGRFDR